MRLLFVKDSTLSLWQAARDGRRSACGTNLGCGNRNAGADDDRSYRSRQSASVFSNGRYVLSGSIDRTIRVWDWHSGQTVRCLDRHPHSIQDIALTADGMRLASASTDGTVRIWNWQTGEMLQTIVGHGFGIKGVVFSPDGQQLAKASPDRSVRL